MIDNEPAPHLLEQLDNRQNQVLDELDRLNAQIEAVIASWQKPSAEATSGAAVRGRHKDQDLAEAQVGTLQG